MAGVARRSLALSLLALIGMAASCLAADPSDADRASACVDMIMPGAPDDLRETVKMLALLERDSEGNIVFGGGDADSGAAHTSGYDQHYDRYYEPGYSSHGSDAYDSYGDDNYHAPASGGIVNKQAKVLLIDNVIKDAGDTAGAGLFLDVVAKSPSSGDGNYGKWSASLLRGVTLKDADKKPYLTIQGDADNPDSVTLWAKLSDAGKYPTTLLPSQSPTLSWYNVLGWVPDTLKIDPSPTTCVYLAKCSNKNMIFRLKGTASVSHSGHTLEKASLYELAGRSWFPKHPVKFVCTIKEGEASGCPM